MPANVAEPPGRILLYRRLRYTNTSRPVRTKPVRMEVHFWPLARRVNLRIYNQNFPPPKKT